MLQFNHIDDILVTDLWVTFHFMFYSNFHISHFPQCFEVSFLLNNSLPKLYMFTVQKILESKHTQRK